MAVTILGIGNILLMDEGAGVRVIEKLLAAYHMPDDVEVIDGGTMGLELLPYIEDKENVIIVDVVKSGNPPGTIVRLEGKDVPVFLSSKISPHQLGLSDLLAVAQITDRMPRHIVLIGIEPERIDTGLDLSGTIQSGIDTLVAMVIKELEAIGIRPAPKS